MRVVTVIGPSGSGKTTLVEALSTLDGTKASCLHTSGGGSVTRFEYADAAFALIDIPGGAENLASVGPALAASDAAILVASAEADAAVLCAPYLRLLEEAGLPAFVFVNGIDAAADRVSQIVSALQHYCGHGIVLRQIPMRSDGQITGAIDLISERAWQYQPGTASSLVELPREMIAREREARTALLDTLADLDDHLLEEIVEDQRPPTEELYGIATRALQHHDLLPALLGSARNGNGLHRLMKSLRHEVPGIDALARPAGALAVGCLADNVKHLGKVVLIRALDEIASGSRLAGATLGGLSDIDARSQLGALKPGEIGLAIKSDQLGLGSYLSAGGTLPLPDWAQPEPPVTRRILTPLHERDESRLAGALVRISEVDPGLVARQSRATGQIQIGVHGPQHERRVVGILSDAFGIEVEVSAPPAALRETLKGAREIHYRHRKQSGGAGQFADVLLSVAPGVPGSGIGFSETVKGGAVPRNYIPAVEAGAREALACGPSGNEVVDVEITLCDGKAHSVDSSDFAFRTAGRAAVKQALEEAGTTLLQPIMQVVIEVPSVFAGDLVQIVSGLKGQVLGFENHPSASGWDVFRALLPKDSEEALAQALGSSARGTARFRAQFDHYEPMR